MWIYKETERNSLWTVGHYDPQGRFIPESDHGNSTLAAERCHYLNGGEPAKP